MECVRPHAAGRRHPRDGLAPVQPEDLYDLTWASEPRISPDGKTVAYVVASIDREENAYRGAIWLAAVDGSSPPRQLTSGKKSDSAPRWSPDGTRLAFTSNRDGEKKQLYVLPLEGGEPICLTDLKEDAAQPAWSPDGTRLAFTSRVPDEAYEEKDEKKRLPRRFTRHRYKLDSRRLDRRPADARVRRAGGRFVSRGAADGRRLRGRRAGVVARLVAIAFCSARDDDWDVQLRQAIWLVDPAGGEPRRLTQDDDLYDLPSWSPDGSSIACNWSPGGFDRPRNDRVAVVDVATGERRVLTEELDRQCGPFPSVREPVWEGDSILFAVEDHGNVHVRRMPAAGGDIEPVVDGELWVNSFDAVGGTVVHAASDADDAERDLRGRSPSDRGEQGVLRAGAVPAVGALRGHVARRRRGRGVARSPARLRGGQALSAAAQHPRRSLLPVREQALRRVPGLCAGGLRRRLLEPARLLRLRGGVGSRHPRACRRRSRLGIASTTTT